MQITIEKNVPIPSPVRPGRPSIYPFAAMSVGDSFALPLEGRVRKVRNNGGVADAASLKVSNAASSYSKKAGAKFTVRTLRDEGVVRCWRVA